MRHWKKGTAHLTDIKHRAAGHNFKSTQVVSNKWLLAIKFVSPAMCKDLVTGQPNYCRKIGY